MAEGQQTLVDVLEGAGLIRPQGLTEGQRLHLETLTALLGKDGLLELRALVDDRLEELEQEPTEEQPAGSEALAGSGTVGLSSGSGKNGSGRGWVELKKINGYGPYAYRRWREGKKLRSEYLGKVKESG